MQVLFSTFKKFFEPVVTIQPGALLISSLPVFGFSRPRQLSCLPPLIAASVFTEAACSFPEVAE